MKQFAWHNPLADGNEMSYLESRAIGAATSTQYMKELKEFLKYAGPRGMDLKEPTSVDETIVEYLNKMFAEGHQCYRGDRLIAAFLHHHPQYGKNGSLKLPRCWRAIKGFRKLTPGKTRKAMPLAVWAAVAVEMRRRAHPRMAVFLVLAISTYARPSELLRARVFSLVRPAPGVTTAWSMLLSPAPTKTGEYDTSVMLDSPWMVEWIGTLLEVLKRGHPEDPLWDFDYAAYNKVFRDIVHSFQLDLTPYQSRHSGPSIDRSRNYRSQQAEERPMAGHKECDALREERSSRASVGNPSSKAARPRSHMRGRPWGDLAGPKRRSFIQLRRCPPGSFVMDLFAGDGGVSRACTVLGFRARQWDIRNGPDQDLTKRQVIKRLKREIQRGRVLACMLAPVCTSFSVARDRTKVIRNHQYPWGIPEEFMTLKEKESVHLGNACFRTCLEVMRLLDRYKVPYILENPATSKAWYLPPMVQHSQQPFVHTVVADFCQFGTPWRKRAKFLTAHIDHLDLSRLTKVCSGDKGCCSRTGRQHFQLTGLRADGTPWTRVAQPYPRKLCEALAHALTAHRHTILTTE